MRRGAMSVADLAVWLDLSYHTVRSWRSGSVPSEARREQIEHRLLLLDKAIRADAALPVPLSVRAQERKKYIEGILNRVSRRRS